MPKPSESSRIMLQITHMLPDERLDFLLWLAQARPDVTSASLAQYRERQSREDKQDRHIIRKDT